jgi:hypothetical protein
MDLADYISGLTFDLAQPDTARVESLRFPLQRGGRPDAELLELPNAPVDVYNARLPQDGVRMARSLRPICGIPRMSTFAVAAIINHAVTRMPAGQAYLNVGVYAGFSFLAGMIDNPRQVCVGVDNFAIAAGRPGLLRRFEEARGPAHRFYEMDYLDYFADIQRDQLGVYLYDGDHAYEHQLQGLEQAEPFFADGCVVIVDDTNWEAPRQATIDFVAASAREYDVLLDVATRDHNHPTFWNGLMVLRATGRRRTAQAAEVAGRFEQRSYGPTRQTLNVAPHAAVSTEHAAAGNAPLVSVVLINDDSSGADLASAIEACRAQSWSRTELVVLDRTREAGSGSGLAGGGRAHDGRPGRLHRQQRRPPPDRRRARARTGRVALLHELRRHALRRARAGRAGPVARHGRLRDASRPPRGRTFVCTNLSDCR